MKVLITTSGTGSRLGDLTANRNKSLLLVGNKIAISHIIDSYPADTEFVIATGYLGEQVKQKVLELYPSRKLHFVSVDKFIGPGSSLGYSMLQCRHLLQCPFIFNACDTIIDGNIVEPNQNWIASFQMKNNGQYRTLEVSNGSVTRILDKDEPATDYIHIGLVGIHDYQGFWKAMVDMHQQDKEDQTLNDTSAISLMLNRGKRFALVFVDQWYDTGNPESLSRALNSLSVK